MQFEDREAWAQVAEWLAPGYTNVAQAARSGGDDPFDELWCAMREAGLSTYIDCKTHPNQLRHVLRAMRTFPGKFRWHWYPPFVAGLQELDMWDANAAALEEIGERCTEIGYALLAMELQDDGYGLTALGAGRVPRLLDLTAGAGREFRVVRRGLWKR